MEMGRIKKKCVIHSFIHPSSLCMCVVSRELYAIFCLVHIEYYMPAVLYREVFVASVMRKAYRNPSAAFYE